MKDWAPYYCLSLSKQHMKEKDRNPDIHCSSEEPRLKKEQSDIRKREMNPHHNRKNKIVLRNDHASREATSS
jgi:arylamine N-acetyltransferase